MKVVWNPEAKKNLQTIRDYYHQFSPPAAKRITKGIVLATKRLESWPSSGRIVPEIEDPDFREVIYSGWRIIYMLPIEGEGPLEILNIIHSAQQFGASP